MSGDKKNWAIIRKSEVGKCGANKYLRIEKSSISQVPYKVLSYNRPGNIEDPWISLEDHSKSIHNGTLLYGEDSTNGKGLSPSWPHYKSFTQHKGLSVYIGNYLKDIYFGQTKKYNNCHADLSNNKNI